MITQQAAERIEALIAAMTVVEKIGQLTLRLASLVVVGPRAATIGRDEIRAGRVGTVLHLRGAEQTREVQRFAVEETRLGIPLLFAGNVLHGDRTIFPVPLAEAAAFDPDLWARTARCAALEAVANGMTLNFAPMLDVARDARWGRIAESPGEDPWLAAQFARAKVEGAQGGKLDAADRLAVTAKHLAGYGQVTAGRDYAPVEMSERTFHEVHLPPFRAAVEAGVACIMPGFTDLAGVPLTASVAVLRDLVRGDWGFRGVLVSDYSAIDELVAHGVAEDLAHAAALALRAGIDIDLMGDAYPKGLPAALERGLVEEAQVDEAVRRVLTLKAALGLFDDPYRRGDASLFTDGRLSEHRALAREAARRSVVLLTNRDGLLPLAPAPRRIAVIGPLADAPAEMMGPWSMYADGREMISLLEGLRAAFADSEIRHARGVEIEARAPADIAGALELARAADVVVLCLGEAAHMSGEAASRAKPGLPGRQAELARAVLEVGRPVVVLLSCGRPLLEPWLFERAAAVLATWFLGSEAGHAVGDVLSGRCNPSGKLPVSWPVEVGQIPVFYGQPPTGRPFDAAEKYTSKYLDLPNEPLFPFGHGLSYTRFELGDLRVGSNELRPGERLAIEVAVANRGARAGEATVLLFIRDPVASVSRPVLELKGMAKAVLEAGAATTLGFALTTDDLTFLGPDLVPRLEPGLIELFVGPSADPQQLLRTSIRLVLP